MNVIKIPYNEFLGLQLSDKEDYLLMLENKSEYRNHLDTVHASALFALAEATSGLFLSNEFPELQNVIPVVRKVETKYRKPATNKVYSNAKLLETKKQEVLNDMENKGKTFIKVAVSLFENDNNLIMQSTFEWFVAKNK